MNIQTLKGFRDFLPETARKRQFILDTLKKVFESYGFEPLETPALEYEEILTGKYGAEGDKLMYKFTDNGDRKVAMRYDQTVPLARVISQYQNDLPTPFKRYQMQNVWRAENTQKGRYREFLQVDADIVGSYSPLSDIEIVSLAANTMEKLGFKDYKILINDRNAASLFFSTSFNIKSEKLGLVFRALDKKRKIGEEGVEQELISLGFEKNQAKEILDSLKGDLEPSDFLKNIFSELDKMGVLNYEFDRYLSRGLDYYTGLVFEIIVNGYDAGSIAGGGRYDNLIGMFAGKNIPAVGFAFGFDRLMEAMETLDLFPKNLNGKNILVAFNSSELQKNALEISNKLREMNLNSEIYLEDATLEKQLKYANKKNIPFVLIVSTDNLVLKDMSSGEQKEITIEQLPNELLK